VTKPKLSEMPEAEAGLDIEALVNDAVANTVVELV
jgi:hypothetical protein